MFTLKIVDGKSLLLIAPLGKLSNVVFSYDDISDECSVTEIEAVAIALKNRYPKIFRIIYETTEKK